MIVDDVRRSYGAVTALDGMTWSARAGEVTVVLGPNGAGKTTVMECLEGLQRPDSGMVRVLDTDPWQASADHRARVGVMLQDGGLPNGARPMAVLHHLALFHADPIDVVAIARKLGIDGFAGRTVRRLSGGQRQRVAFAAALVGRPEVLFLDEPTAGLDPHARLDVYEIIRAERDRGAGIVVTTHSFEEAEELADHVVIVRDGTVAMAGRLDQIRGTGRLADAYFTLTGSTPR
ncbi:Tungstate uptake system ATP-binding protein TupC [Austwickia sp. TVS 96-490-7B]|uniref:ABC transporter ATP-binding protein n=1 Tax=Austwickia sp. TVS 96-490-7B TaxID=2830843 RepID=UPI001D9BE27F|nr:Tungstate uptake system ATP-binding protein TupC [Austwickia sp. TVS 96-490-7B]